MHHRQIVEVPDTMKSWWLEKGGLKGSTEALIIAAGTSIKYQIHRNKDPPHYILEYSRQKSRCRLRKNIPETVRYIVTEYKNNRICKQ